MQKEEGPTFVCEICFEEQPTTKGISCTKSALLNEGLTAFNYPSANLFS